MPNRPAYPGIPDPEDDPTAGLIATCPKCKFETLDLDGFGFVYCPECRYCLHLSRTNGRCLICGDKEKKRGHEETKDGGGDPEA